MIGVAYGVVAYLSFLATFAYAVLWVEGLLVPKTIDSGASSSLGEALAFDCGWFVLFAIQHSGMARASFKERWTKLVPERAERSTYVLASSFMIAWLIASWRPLIQPIWTVEMPALRIALYTLSLGGWGFALLSSFSIDHLELFGLRQVLDAAKKKKPEPPSFRMPRLYALVRHPLYLGFVIGSWVTPQMTLGHLIFAIGATAYILLGMYFEERDLVRTFGDEYRRYAARVPALFPWPRPRGQT